MNRPVFQQAVAWSVVAFLMAYPSEARADVDLSGEYRVDVNEPPLGQDVCTATVVQSGPALDLTMDCWGGTGALASGSIDPVTGVFSVSGTCTFDSGGPGPFEFDGVGAASSLSFTLSGTCSGVDTSMYATKCGNGTVDSGEECDDGNRSDGDCCSATCAAETGQVCDAASPICTLAACDASGTCVPGAVTESAGSACDLDADLCTEDLCDGEGACLPTGEAVTCGTCEKTCEATTGCVGDPFPTRAHPGPGECQFLVVDRDAGKVRNHLTDDRKDHLLWRWSTAGSVSAVDFGTPTVSTDYTLCMFDSGDNRVLGSLEIPAGSAWSATSSGFRHRSVGPDGKRVTIVLKGNDSGRGRAKILVNAKGSALGYPNAFDTQSPSLGGVRLELRGDAGKCWVSGLPRDHLKTTPAAQLLRFER